MDSSETLVATISVPEVSDKEGERNGLAESQMSDIQLRPIIEYLRNGSLPTDENAARELMLNKKQYVLLDDVLYNMVADGTLHVITPVKQRREIIKEAHDEKFGAHLQDAKVFSQISRSYWWSGMRKEVTQYCRSCEKCASRHVGKAIKPPLTPIPVNGPFDRVGVDVIKFPRSSKGNTYAVVFMDYLTKWPEVYATQDQTSLTIAELLVKNVISRHGVPVELLSDRGTAFLSKIMIEVYKLLGIKKSNTTAHHPQTDGLVERFHRTLTNMLAKRVHRSGKDWDEQLPYVLFAYRSSVQMSTQESPFYLLYGRDPRLPAAEVLAAPDDRRVVDVRDYKTELCHRFTEVWKLAQSEIQKAQKSQKKYYDQKATRPKVCIDDRVFVCMRTERLINLLVQNKGPHRVLKLFDNGVEVKLVT